MSAGVPVVDIGPFLDGTSEGKSTVGEAVAGACEEIGFLLVTGHGVRGELVDDAYRLSRAFFDLPPQEKLPLSTGELVPGLPVYRPVAAESLAASLGAVSPGDLKESLDWGRSLEGIGWPERPSGLRPAWERYFEEMLGLGGT
ncbi:MAG: 2-oxoglutarate and iron-dependent oxygenase domain-containing protein, partial [Gaiellaceae bacterium]